MSDCEIIFPERDRYRKLVTPELLDFPGSVFYEPIFLITAAEVLNLEFEPAIAIRDNKVIGLANFLIGKRAGIRSASIPRLFQYYGPIGLGDDPGTANDLALGLIDKKVDLCVYSLTPEASPQFKLTNWQITDRLTYYLDTGDYDSMLTACNSNCKNKINKAIRNDILINESPEFPIDIYLKTFSRRNLNPPISPDTLVRWADQLYENGLLKTFIASHNSISVAFRSVFYYGRYAYNWVSGVIPEGFKYGASNLLMLKVGEYLFNEGISHYDLVGGDIKSIAEFKKSFGGHPRKHVQVEKTFTLKGKAYRGLMKMKARMNE